MKLNGNKMKGAEDINKRVVNAKYKLGNVYTFTTKICEDEKYLIVTIVDIRGIKKARYDVVIVFETGDNRGFFYNEKFSYFIRDLTEKQLERLYLKNKCFNLTTERDLRFLVKFGNTPTCIVQEILSSKTFNEQIRYDIVLIEKRLEKMVNKAKAFKEINKQLKEKYGT